MAFFLHAYDGILSSRGRGLSVLVSAFLLEDLTILALRLDESILELVRVCADRLVNRLC